MDELGPTDPVPPAGDASPDDDDLDGCDIDFNEHLVDQETAGLTALFAGVPDDQVEATAAFYRALGASDA